MTASRRVCGRWIGLVLLASLLLTVRPPAAGAAQEPSETEVKAAFFFNFAKFAEWPSLATAAPIVLCVVGDGGVAIELTDLVRGRTINGHAIEVVRPRDGTWNTCHMLYLAGADTRHAASALTGLRMSPVLTVSDGPNFSRSGGMIELYLEGRSMRFAINTDAVNRSGVHLSSRLLGAARIVRDADER